MKLKSSLLCKRLLHLLFHAGWYRAKHYEPYGLGMWLHSVSGADTSSDNPVCVVAHHKALWAGRSGADFMCRGLTVNYQQ